MAGVIKKNFPKSRVLFMGRTYTKDVIELCAHVDQFINYDEIEKLPAREQSQKIRALKADVFLHVFPRRKIALLAKQADVPVRAGTTNRIYHWWTCTKLIRLSRKNSPLHEAQLNIKLLDFLKINTAYSLTDLVAFYGIGSQKVSTGRFDHLIDKNKFNLILHPKSKGSAVEWGLDNFKELAHLLPAEKFKVFISGTAKDAEAMTDFLKDVKATDITGKMNLAEFISFIAQCDGLVAASTGPLHIASALGKKAIGLFSSRRPIHPGRWQPLGERAKALVYDENCTDCKNKPHCDCITKISPKTVIKALTA